MDIYVKELPECCGDCWIRGISKSGSWCPLLFDEDNNCVEIHNNFIRLPNCPLKVIEQWRLESCATCGRYECVMASNNSGNTCKDWQEKVNE